MDPRRGGRRVRQAHGWHKIGIATCIGLFDLANVLAGILRSHGLEVFSVACKNGSIPKEEIGMPSREDPPRHFRGGLQPDRPGRAAERPRLRVQRGDGPVRRPRQPVLQARHGAHTVLVAKDRVLGHNPVAALQQADSYYSRLWGPDRPAKPPKLPVAGRKGG